MKRQFSTICLAMTLVSLPVVARSQESTRQDSRTHFDNNPRLCRRLTTRPKVDVEHIFLSASSSLCFALRLLSQPNAARLNSSELTAKGEVHDREA